MVMWDGCTLASLIVVVIPTLFVYLVCLYHSYICLIFRNLFFFYLFVPFGGWDVLERLLIAGHAIRGIHNAGVFVVLCDLLL